MGRLSCTVKTLKSPSTTAGPPETLTSPMDSGGGPTDAVYDALGKRFYSLPMSPPKVLEGLEG